jgi:hypothetical protein
VLQDFHSLAFQPNSNLCTSHSPHFFLCNCEVIFLIFQYMLSFPSSQSTLPYVPTFVLF